MINLTVKSDINLAIALPFDMSTVSAKTETPENHIRTLGNLAATSFLKSKFYCRASGTTGTAKLKIFSGNNEIKSYDFDFGSLAENTVSDFIDLSAAQVSTEIKVEIECTATGGDGVLFAWLECETPLIITT